MTRRKTVREKWKRKGLAAALLIAGLLLAACQQAPEIETEAPPDPTPTVEPQPTEEPPWEPMLLQTIRHGDRAHSVAFSPDGSQVAAGVYLEVRLYDLDDYSLVRSIEHRHGVEDLAFSPDGEMLAAGQGVYGVRLSNVDDGAAVLDLHGGYEGRVAFAPDGETVITGNRDGLVWKWRVEDGEQLGEWSVENPENTRAVACSPTGDLVASGHYDGSVYLWDADDGALRRTLAPGGGFAKAEALAFSPDGELLAVAGAVRDRDRVVAVWRADDGSIHRELEVGQDANGVAFSPDGEFLAAGGNDGVYVWQTSDWALLYLLEPLDDEGDVDWVQDVALSPDGRLLAAVTWNGALVLYQIQP
jgi:WD40 repeat protein